MNRIVTLESDGLTISGQLFIPTEGVKVPAPTICLCHGVPSGISDPGDKGYPFLAETLCHEGFVVLFFNFRGAGVSGGNFDMLGWTRDLKVAIDYLWALPEVDKAHLSLLGFSAGAAAAIYVTARDKRISSIVACACPADFTFITKASAPQSIIDRYRRIGIIRDKDFPPSIEEWLNNFRIVTPINSVAKIAPRPLLLAHSRQDEVVPVSHANRLYEKAGEPKRLTIFDGAEHRLRRNEQAIAIITNWLKSHAQIN